ncbi:hypothetical protein C5F59_031445 [Streptomyces sp. QL37]|uniref:hypothetical protein n=1 Tax=Streptomyces sp. QL37 TaxID=2093747 RepID=UPI0021CAFFD4|nr:hypothetical protein [Streptomyces sp. QL37]
MATPWALAAHSWVLAVLAVVVLIGLRTVFSTPADKAQVIVPVPGRVTVLLVLPQLAAAVISAWRPGTPGRPSSCPSCPSPRSSPNGAACGGRSRWIAGDTPWPSPARCYPLRQHRRVVQA